MDLLGFGHAEKPAISYTQYFWEDQVCAGLWGRAVQSGRAVDRWGSEQWCRSSAHVKSGAVGGAVGQWNGAVVQGERGSAVVALGSRPNLKSKSLALPISK